MLIGRGLDEQELRQQLRDGLAA
ncbi:MAG: hypothetical protein ACFCU8_01845 [Thermosynechococcaceae cyanobacterium]